MEANPRSSKLNALIMEDEALIAEELRERISELGHDVIGMVDSAEDGVEIAIRDRPNLVLVDIRLKGEKDGITAVKEIQQQLQLAIIYITAHSDVPTFKRVHETIYDGFLLKPFQGRDLRSTIETALFRYELRVQHGNLTAKLGGATETIG